jgi:7-cyano-7-deazaguanine reductase
MSLTYLGKVAPPFILATDLEVVEAPPGLSQVVFRGAELTALCPVTGAPDIYEVSVLYNPGDSILESKSLKLYFNGWRDQGIFCENLATVIAGDLATALDVEVTVTLVQQPRGGLSISATAEGKP